MRYWLLVSRIFVVRIYTPVPKYSKVSVSMNDFVIAPVFEIKIVRMYIRPEVR